MTEDVPQPEEEEVSWISTSDQVGGRCVERWGGRGEERMESPRPPISIRTFFAGWEEEAVGGRCSKAMSLGAWRDVSEGQSWRMESDDWNRCHGEYNIF